MANIRIEDLPSEAAPAGIDVVPIDGTTTRKTTLTAVADATRPYASQADAEAGILTTSVMSPLRTKQAIAAQGSVLFATAAQGNLADAAVQPGDLAAVATAGTYASLTAKPTLGTAAAAATTDFAAAVAAVPTGGLSGQVLRKTSNTNYAVGWGTPAGGGDMISSANLSDVASVTASRTNIGVGLPKFIQARLSLLSGEPVTSSDIIGAGTIYAVPYLGNVISRYNGTYWVNDEVSEMTLVLDSNTGHTGYHAADANFDVFFFDDAGTKRIGTGPAWTGLNARGTGAGTTECEKVDGVWLNKNSITLRWGTASGNTVSVPARRATLLGSFRTAGGVALTRDDAVARHVSSVTGVSRSLYYADAGSSYTYSVATIREARGSTSGRVYVFNCLPRSAWANYNATVSNSTASYVYPGVNIGIDSTTTTSAIKANFAACSQSDYAQAEAYWEGELGIGLHIISALEKGAGSDTQTWWPVVSGFSDTSRSALIGGVQA